MTETKRCSFTIEGPRLGGRVVAWRKQCQRKTRHESGRCWQHREAA